MVCIFIVVVVAVILYFAPVISWLGISGHVDASTGTLTLVALVLQVIFTILFGIVGAGYRAVGHYAIAIASGSTARMLEGAALLITASLGGDFFTAAAIMLVVRIVVETAFLLVLHRTAPWLKFGLKHADAPTIRRMFWPSLSFMAYTVSNMINIQGVTIIVGMVLGPAVVAAVSAMRTVSRLGITASNMISHTLQAEYSRYVGAGETSRIKHVFKKHLIVIGALIVAFLLCSTLLGHRLIDIWTKGKLLASEPLFTLLLIGIALEMMWTALQTPLISINKHQTTATVFLLLSLAGLFACRMLLPGVGVDSVGYVAIMIGIVMCLLSGMRARQWWLALPPDRTVAVTQPI
jgi:O-antigen/teichoic acid export membrane protein